MNTYTEFFEDSCSVWICFAFCAINSNETAHELSFKIIGAVVHHSITSNRHYFNVHSSICQQIDKMSVEDWKLCRHNHGYHGKADTSITDIVEVKEMYDIAVQDHTRKRLIDL